MEARIMNYVINIQLYIEEIHLKRQEGKKKKRNL